MSVVPTPVLFNKPVSATVDQLITATKPGRVKFQGSIWRARVFTTDGSVAIAPSHSVLVIGRQGITLLVEPIEGHL